MFSPCLNIFRLPLPEISIFLFNVTFHLENLFWTGTVWRDISVSPVPIKKELEKFERLSFVEKLFSQVKL